MNTKENIQKVIDELSSELNPVMDAILEESHKTKLIGRVEIGTGEVIIDSIETHRMKDLLHMQKIIQDKYKSKYPNYLI
tara:strand:- start:76 stop:312 length:237 start_codon:yes stop_codon:yes gene_type:complete